MVTTRWITVLLASMLSAGSAAAETSRGRPAEPDEAAQVRGNSEFAFDLYGGCAPGPAMCSSPHTAFPMPWP